MTKQQKNGFDSKNNSSSFGPKSKDITDAKTAPGNDKKRKMIAEAAYFLSLSRNVEGGDPVKDWLEAEKEIRTRLSAD